MLFTSLIEEIEGNLWALSNQLTSIILTTIVICAISITYNVKIRAHKEGEQLSGFLVLVDMFVSSVEHLVVSIMGRKYRILTPYAMFIILYICVGSLFALLGIESQTTSYTVTLSMGFVTFVMIYYFGFKYQKAAYLKRYFNPIEIFTQFTPLLSISFRLFGNLLGGSIIMGLIYALFIGMQASWGGTSTIDGHTWPNWDFWNPMYQPDTWKQQYIYFWSGLNIFTTVVTPFLHMYFDLFDAVIQSIVFIMLTLSYWSEAMGDLTGDDLTTTTRARKSSKLIELKERNTVQTV
ncbi:F0F1 ATP synthase subunit A [Mesoplasma seiffertii]|uniref:F0F1 ATP synthase subunit A n=1 Tax=Mesoplasma seiffertii TaxID=28224 RepID=UPI0005691411|nr:F0F1 ATP synthase subunit A [Mesoplasma seiffertii]